MKRIITINTENDAFSNEYDEGKSIAELLIKLAEKFQNMDNIPRKLYDINGNVCGTVEIE